MPRRKTPVEGCRSSERPEIRSIARSAADGLLVHPSRIDSLEGGGKDARVMELTLGRGAQAAGEKRVGRDHMDMIALNHAKPKVFLTRRILQSGLEMILEFLRGGSVAG